MMTMESHRAPGVRLPADYKPSPHTVIVGRGKEPKLNLGNKRLQVLASSFLNKYQQGDKRIKTQIVTEIIFMIKEACGEGGAFVKHGKNGEWYELDNSVAREKIGYVFRDLLADDYKSSSKSKVARRHSGPSSLPRQQQASMESPTAASLCSKIDASFSCSPSTSSTDCKRRSSFNISDILIQSKTSLDDFLLNLSEIVEEDQQGFVPLSLSCDENSERFDQEFMSSLPLLLA